MPVYVLGKPAREATTASLLIVGGIALAGARDRVRSRMVDVRAAALFGVTGAPGAVAGTLLKRFAPERLLLLLFALLLVAVVAANGDRTR